ncbi:hypothetical protein TrVE_jg849 [Triparma verrucosa]|uniref:WW domain-containing protein n=1 Tax=Triparma verrucosa TaxID=1606542 RepID=A0A9W7CMI5_9STRA|nr:hypothetical protein TrVE_jg849 [Triparma verrucosa]
MKVYKNGVLAGTKTDGWEPNILTRTNHIIGNRAENDRPFDGTIAYIKVWHSVELQQSDVTDLAAARCFAGEFFSLSSGCSPCPFGTYSGSYTQLSAGLLMGIAYVVGVSNLHPYVEQRDNIVAILTGCQLILVFMTASFMKFNLNSSALEDEYDLQGMGVVLICSYVIIFCLFFAWAIYQKDDEHVSTNSAATKLIKRLGEASASARSKHKSEIELSERSFGGEETFFAGENPMARNPKKNSSRNLAGSLVVEEEDAEEEIVKPPAAPPTCPWTRLWDEGEQEFYYVHEDGKTSTWDTPAEFFKK